jgi:hypothetical protein
VKNVTYLYEQYVKKITVGVFALVFGVSVRRVATIANQFKCLGCRIDLVELQKLVSDAGCRRLQPVDDLVQRASLLELLRNRVIRKHCSFHEDLVRDRTAPTRHRF